MANKKTKRNYFEEILNLVEGNEELTNFVNHELELLDKKNANRGTSKTQKENEGIKDEVIKALRVIGEPVTITELQAKDETMAQYSNQKLSALLKQLVETNKVIRTQDKKKALFEVNDEQN